MASSLKVSFDIRRIEARDDEGRSIHRDADFVIFRQAGDNKTIVEKEITPEEIESWNNPHQSHKAHVPALYKAWKDGVDAPVDGTPLKEWPLITPPQLHKALTIGISSVEDFATLNDEGLTEFGAGAVLLKQKAKNWLDSANSQGRIVEKMTAQDVQMKQMQEQMEKMQHIIEQQAAAIESKKKKPE